MPSDRQLELAAKYGHDNVLSAQAIIMGNPERAHRFYLGEISAEELVRGHPGELEALLERWESEE